MYRYQKFENSLFSFSCPHVVRKTVNTVWNRYVTQYFIRTESIWWTEAPPPHRPKLTNRTYDGGEIEGCHTTNELPVKASVIFGTDCFSNSFVACEDLYSSKGHSLILCFDDDEIVSQISCSGLTQVEIWWLHVMYIIVVIRSTASLRVLFNREKEWSCSSSWSFWVAIVIPP